MEFNSDRLMVLSGVKPDEKQTLTEGSAKRKKSRDRQKIAETKLRKAIRSEIEAIVEEVKSRGDSSWMFRGMKKPGRSKGGSVTLGLLGLGFKQEGE
jgi:hypothetical protein